MKKIVRLFTFLTMFGASGVSSAASLDGYWRLGWVGVKHGADKVECPAWIQVSGLNVRTGDWNATAGENEGMPIWNSWREYVFNPDLGGIKRAEVGREFDPKAVKDSKEKQFAQTRVLRFDLTTDILRLWERVETSIIPFQPQDHQRPELKLPTPKSKSAQELPPEKQGLIKSYLSLEHFLNNDKLNNNRLNNDKLPQSAKAADRGLIESFISQEQFSESNEIYKAVREHHMQVELADLVDSLRKDYPDYPLGNVVSYGEDFCFYARVTDAALIRRLTPPTKSSVPNKH